MGTGKFNAGFNPVMYYHLIQGGVEILLVASCYRTWDKLRPDGPLGQNEDFTFLPPFFSFLLYVNRPCVSTHIFVSIGLATTTMLP